jgi:hypothetical protein
MWTNIISVARESFTFCTSVVIYRKKKTGSHEAVDEEEVKWEEELMKCPPAVFTTVYMQLVM